MAFASYDIDSPQFWSLAYYANQNDWTVNCFYLAHIQYDLMESTLQGELNDLSPDTLYVFWGKDELNRSRLEERFHFYRFDDILVGSVEPLPFSEAEPESAGMALTDCSVTEEGSSVVSAEKIVIAPGEMMTSDEWSLAPGAYEVTIQGENLTNSYIHSGYWTADEQWADLDIVFLKGEENEMTFQFTIHEWNRGWNVQIHALNDTPVTVTKIEVSDESG